MLAKISARRWRGKNLVCHAVRQTWALLWINQLGAKALGQVASFLNIIWNWAWHFCLRDSFKIDRKMLVRKLVEHLAHGSTEKNQNTWTIPDSGYMHRMWQWIRTPELVLVLPSNRNVTVDPSSGLWDSVSEPVKRWPWNTRSEMPLWRYVCMYVGGTECARTLWQW